MILVFGKTGQVARELQQLRPSEVVALERNQADLTDLDECTAAIDTFAPCAVINAAAYTNVDLAESEEEQAQIINGKAPAAMAVACAKMDIPFVHISTDYVFKGNGTQRWKAEDPTEPQNAYGRTKLTGEKGTRNAGGRYAILRTSWVFSAHGSNFVKTMLRLSQTHDQLNVVSDQIGGPTPAHAIANACLTIAEQLAQDSTKSGTYHFSGKPDISWHDFAGEIFSQAKKAIALSAITTEEYPTPAARPLNSRLDCTTTYEVFGLPRPDWRASLAGIIDELGTQYD